MNDIANKKMDNLRRSLDQANISANDLDFLVDSLKSEESERINNGGIEAQLNYIVEEASFSPEKVMDFYSLQRNPAANKDPVPVPGGQDLRVGKSLVMNVPQWFDDPDFQEWLNNSERMMFVWEKSGLPEGEYADTQVMVHPSLNGEGSDSEVMPAEYWDVIMLVCQAQFSPSSSDANIMVRLTNHRH